MYDPTIHQQNLARQLRDADFVDQPLLLQRSYRDAVLSAAAAIGTTGFANVALIKGQLRGKPVFGLGDIGQLLVLRQITANIRRVTSVKQDDRRFIVECITSLLKEGVSFRLYKFDVKSFYESIRPSGLVDALSHDIAFSGQSARVLASFFIELDKIGVAGLPRGLSVSATLAEYLMRGFDSFVSNTRGVLYYSRYVDDICVITDGTEDKGEFSKLVEEKLPNGLRFNDKSEDFFFGNFSKDKVSSPEHHIDYLGYRIHISKSYKPSDKSPIVRDVWVDINPKKVLKLKSRIAFSLLAYKRNGDFNELRDRIRLLTANFTIRDRNTKVDRLSGIRFNYPIVDSVRSVGLPELDRFLRNVVMSPHARNRLRPTLTTAQRDELIRYTFRNGFDNKVFFHFSPKRLATLTGCWSYV